MEHGLWKACAGTSNMLPKLGDLVYYFPEGHAEHAYTTSPDCSSSSPAPVKPAHASMLLCRIAYLHLSAHSISHEVYAKFIIIPSSSPAFADPKQIHPHPPEPPHPCQEQYINYARVLEPSDFGKDELSIPCECADSIFPKLDYKLNPPMQIFHFSDVHGKPWEFKHVYRSNRHLLTAGWTKFVDSNFLFHGDTVIFIRDPYRSLNDKARFFIGIRRTICSRTKLSYRFPSQNEEEEESEGEEGCYTRRTLCRVSQKSVEEAERRAVAGQPFMAAFYPNSGLSEFVVPKETVDASMAVKWAPGMRVRMTMVDAETSSSRTGPTYHGTVSCTGSLQENDRSTCSGWARWQSLEIEWDDREMMNKMKNVNPWEVEPAGTTTQRYPIVKRMKLEEGTSHEEVCRISQKFVEEVERLAVAEQPFMATFNSNAGWLEFEVDKASSSSMKWAPGMRVRKITPALPNSAPRPTYYGTVSSTGSPQENDRLSCSSMQTLEIEWDDPEMINYRKVDAWDVEPIVTTTLPYNIKKRMKQEEGTSHAGLHCNGSSSTAICEQESQKNSNSGDSDSPTSDIMSKAAVGSQKTFKLFGKIIQIEVEIQ